MAAVGSSSSSSSRRVFGLAMGGLALSIALCAAVVAAHGQHEHLLRRQTLAKCRYDDDCMPNAFCWNQEACLCKDDYIVYRNRTHVRCLKVASALGDRCEANVQCQVTFAPYSECQDNICQCSDGSHYEEGRCYESVGLGGTCQTHHNCYIKDSYCVTGFCACTLRHHPNPRNDGCIRSIELGDRCLSDYECIAENSRCIEVCSCRVDHVLSSDGKRCLKAANLIGEPCEEDSQCHLFLRNSRCGDDDRCSCETGFHRRGPACLRDIGLGHPCQNHLQCVTETYQDSNSTDVMNVDCLDGICDCAEDYIMAEEVQDCIQYTDNGAEKWQSTNLILLVILVILFAH